MPTVYPEYNGRVYNIYGQYVYDTLTIYAVYL